jgi:hypothetical protein
MEKAIDSKDKERGKKLRLQKNKFLYPLDISI